MKISCNQLFNKGVKFGGIMKKSDIDEIINTDSSYRSESKETTKRRNDSIILHNINNSFLHQNEQTLETQKIAFKFQDNNILVYELDSIICACPIFEKYQEFLNKESNLEVEIPLPDWMDMDNITEFFLYINDPNYSNFRMSVRKLLYIADYFNNQEVVKNIINDEIILKIGYDDALVYLKDSFNKISDNDENSAWFDLFFQCLSFISENLVYYVDYYYEDLKSANKEIVEEIVEKFFRDNHNKVDNFIQIPLQTYRRLIDLLIHARNLNNIHDLLLNEYYRQTSEQSEEEILKGEPNFKLKFTHQEQLEQYKEQSGRIIDKQEFVFSYFIRKTPSTFNICVKSKFPYKNVNNLKVISFFSKIRIKQSPELFLNQHFNSVSDQKMNINIFQYNKEEIEELLRTNNKITFKVFMKVCYLHSAILNYYIINFVNFSKEKEFHRLTFSSLLAVFSNKLIPRLNQNDFISLILTWQVKNKNFKDDILIILNNVKWGEVSNELLMSFIIKNHGLEIESLKDIFNSRIEPNLFSTLTKSGEILSNLESEIENHIPFNLKENNESPVINKIKIQFENFEKSKPNLNDLVDKNGFITMCLPSGQTSIRASQRNFVKNNKNEKLNTSNIKEINDSKLGSASKTGSNNESKLENKIKNTNFLFNPPLGNKLNQYKILSKNTRNSFNQGMSITKNNFLKTSSLTKITTSKVNERKKNSSSKINEKKYSINNEIQNLKNSFLKSITESKIENPNKTPNNYNNKKSNSSVCSTVNSRPIMSSGDSSYLNTNLISSSKTNNGSSINRKPSQSVNKNRKHK